MVAICSASAVEIEEVEVMTFTTAEATRQAEVICIATESVTEPPMNLENYSLDFMTPSNVPADQLEKVLKHELKPLAETFVSIEKEYGINSLLFASLVALESGWGTSPLSQSHNNITSHRTPKGYIHYRSKEACLYYAAENLTDNYFTEGGIYYHGSTTLNDISCYYLLGKPESKMNWDELQSKQKYVEMIEEIYYSMADKINT